MCPEGAVRCGHLLNVGRQEGQGHGRDGDRVHRLVDVLAENCLRKVVDHQAEARGTMRVAVSVPERS